MAYGIQNKTTKKWIEIVHWQEDGTTRFTLADREVGGVWLKSSQEAEKFMIDNKVSPEHFKIRMYKHDRNEIWFKNDEEYLLKVGYYRVGWVVCRPNGSILYEP